MSEFELTPDDLQKQEILRRWECRKCGAIQDSWENPPNKCSSSECDSLVFRQAIAAHTVPATTGHEIELSYDNLHTIDDANDKDFEITEQNRDLEKLEKARR